jgi:hypothetical protein
MEIFSVVPRVTEAQPTHGSASAAAKISLIIERFPKPVRILTQPLREGKWREPQPAKSWLIEALELAPPRPCPESCFAPLPSLFKLIRGIVRGTDSLRYALRATHEKA